MKYSLKRQLAIICTILVGGTVLLCYILNTLFLGDYYTNKKKNHLKDAFETINAASNSGSIDSDAFDLQLRSICGTYNLDMVVMDEKTYTVKSSDNDPSRLISQLLGNLFEQSDVKEDKNYVLLEEQERYTLQIRLDSSMEEKYIEMWGLLDNGNLFLIRSSLAGIQDSVSIANTFLAYVAIGSILVSIVISNLLSKKMTKPILELADISSKMKKLDFDAKYTGNSKTEIAILGQNINELSETLEETISELKTANMELQSDLKRKTKEEELRKAFLSDVSHELKTPIALIQGYAEGLKEGIADDSESRDFYLDVIMDEAGKMSRLVKELMNLNQLEAGADSISMERFDLAEMIRDYLQTLTLLCEQENINLKCEMGETLYVWGDPFKLQQVITNYLSNAMHHVDIDEVTGEKLITVSARVDGSKTEVSVFNTGHPIPEDSIEYIWDKFYKVDKARTREYGGSGIGLSIVQAIMNSFHQEYGVRNKENGVEFYFTVETA